MSAEIDDFRLRRINPVGHGFEPNTSNLGVFSLATSANSDANTLASLGRVIREDEVKTITLTLPYQIAEDYPLPHDGLDVTHDPENDDVYYMPHGTDPDHIDVLVQRRRGLVARPQIVEPFLDSKDWPTLISAEAAAEPLNSFDPRSILFLTGAGMSAAQVSTHAQVAAEAGFEYRAKTESGFARNEDFIHEFLENENKIEEVRDAFSRHILQQKLARPSAAHIAFSAMVGKLDDRPLAATFNIDKMHEDSGVVVPRILGMWPNAKASEIQPEAEFAHNLERRVKSIGLVVAMGISFDEKGIIDYVRSQSSDVKLLTFNSAHPKEISYMTSSDVYVQGDCHETLPFTVDALAALKK